MLCPKCRGKTSVMRTIIKNDFTIRFRKCNNKKCNHKFKTKEMLTTGWDYKSVVLKIKNLVDDIN